MNNRQRMRAVLHYEPYDRMPVVHFGFWTETLTRWADQGHISRELALAWGDNNAADREISAMLGFDIGYHNAVGANAALRPGFESKVIEVTPEGFSKVLNSDGVVVLRKEGAGSIPSEVDHLLKTRKEWEEHYRWRLEYSDDRAQISEETRRYVDDPERAEWVGVHCGSLFGAIRNWVGVEGTAYIYADDPALFREMIDTVGELCYRCTERLLQQATRFDFAHFWEDICFKTGPLINPRVFDEMVGPHYRRITKLVNDHGIDVVSLDCDGNIDALVPIWFENGVNTMFPIEVGTWNASIVPWRERFGKELRGVGGMNKVVFSRDYAAIDEEIERLRPLVEMGGYVPCPDHRIAPDAKWENVQYYCERVRDSSVEV